MARILSSGVVVVRKEGDVWLYLLLRAYNYWDFPKGIVEANESPIDAAIREVEEETSINDLIFNWGYDYRETEPYNRGKVARYYIAETLTRDVKLPINPVIGKPEHDEYRWVTFDEAMSLVSNRLKPIITWAHSVIESKDSASK